MILLDSPTVLWWRGNRAELSSKARRAIDRADRLLVSPITFWEVGLLVQRGRIRLDRGLQEWTDGVLAEERVETATLTPRAAADAALLGVGFPDDPADRFLYTTARELLVPLVTKDERLHDYARAARDVRTIW